MEKKSEQQSIILHFRPISSILNIKINLSNIHLNYFILGEAPDGTKYKTAYRCEGQDLRISCDPGQTIQVIRANYGRFSIAICNKNGYTDWSVNCMSHTTTRILQRK